MKEMTSAEFAKTNLAALAEPVSIRRYTKPLGTYYPEGFTPAEAPDMGLDSIPDFMPAKAATKKRVEELEEEVKRLKRELAARPPALPTGNADLVATPRRTIKPKTIDPDIPQGMNKQDREFFERKLGRRG